MTPELHDRNIARPLESGAVDHPSPDLIWRRIPRRIATFAATATVFSDWLEPG